MPDMETYWLQRAKEQSDAMKAKREANPTIPSLSQIYQDGDQVHQAQIQQQQAEIAASPYAWHGEGMPMTPQARAAWKEQFFAEKEKQHA